MRGVFLARCRGDAAQWNWLRVEKAALVELNVTGHPLFETGKRETLKNGLRDPLD